MTRQREQRHSVMLRARMQVDGPFREVSVRNISSRGMLLHSPYPPKVGEYVELFGTVTAVGRVRWCDGQSFGIATRDRVNVPLILGTPELRDEVAKGRQERRVRETVESADDSRRLGRAIDFILVALGVAFLGGLFALVAYGVLSRPLDALGNLLR